MVSNSAWTLTETETARLQTLEKVVGANIQGVIEAGAALLAIRDERLYRRDYDSFEDYANNRWGLARRTAYQYMEAAKVVEDVRNCAQLPANEAQARELAKVPQEKRAEVWQRAVETTPDGGMTAQHVRNTVRPYRGDLYPKPVEKVAKGFPSGRHKYWASRFILETRDPRGTVAKFLGVHDSVVSNLIYLDVATRSAMAEKRETLYLEAAQDLGISVEETRAWLAEQRQEVV